MNTLSPERRAQVVAALVEGNSIRVTVRMTGVAKHTVVKLLVELGRACDRYQRETLVNLRCRRIQCDEIWSFVYAKEKNADPEMKAAGTGRGHVDVDRNGCRLQADGVLARREPGRRIRLCLDRRSSLSAGDAGATDHGGHKPYLEAVEGVFGADVDYAMLVKLYGEPQEPEKTYSPVRCIGTRRIEITGRPDPDHISTSYVERQNLTMRMSMPRFTRLTNGFSKKVANLETAVSLHFMWYNFGRIHQSLRVTPAMEGGVTDHVWTLAEIVALLD